MAFTDCHKPGLRQTSGDRMVGQKHSSRICGFYCPLEEINNEWINRWIKIIIKVVGVGLSGIIFSLRNESWEGANNQWEKHARKSKKYGQKTSNKKEVSMFSETRKRIHKSCRDEVGGGSKAKSCLFKSEKSQSCDISLKTKKRVLSLKYKSKILEY